MTTCSWCGHLHDEACTRTITVKVGKTTNQAPCPCMKRNLK